MPLSPQFIQLFKKLTTDYSQKAKGGLIFYKKDEHYDYITSNLNSILTSIEYGDDGGSLFEDKSLISVLAVTATRYLVSDPWFANLVSTFLSEYYEKDKTYSFITDPNMLIQINPEAKHSINVLNELQRAIGNLQNAHQSQIAMLTDQINCQQTEMNLLKEQNGHLREQVRGLESAKNQWEKLSTAGPILEQIKKTVASLNDLITTKPEPDKPLAFTNDFVQKDTSQAKQDLMDDKSNNEMNSTSLPIGSVAMILDNLTPPPKAPTPPPIWTSPNITKKKDTSVKPTTLKSSESDQRPIEKPPAKTLSFHSELEEKIAERRRKGKQNETLEVEKKSTLQI
ncbi:hypothetical protein ACNVED_01910 [Legionella sp. D16C41]|uniref:hypothetical protein n=1 Tax=Legionella sp. D16C41 TaxID=3402688 RepID=UPI003AF74501